LCSPRFDESRRRTARRLRAPVPARSGDAVWPSVLLGRFGS